MGTDPERTEQNEQALLLSSTAAQFSAVTKHLEGSLREIQIKLGVCDDDRLIVEHQIQKVRQATPEIIISKIL